jgi:hypothetical protein
MFSEQWVRPMASMLCIMIYLIIAMPLGWAHPMKGLLVKWFRQAL